MDKYYRSTRIVKLGVLIGVTGGIVILIGVLFNNINIIMAGGITGALGLLLTLLANVLIMVYDI